MEKDVNVKLDKIKLSGFKSIEKLDIELRSLNILIGPNGAGKSNFMSFFTFVNKLIEQNLQFYVSQQLGADRFLFYGRKRTEALEIYIEFTLNAYRCKLAADASGGVIFVEEESVSFMGGHKSGPTSVRLRSSEGNRESSLPDQNPRHLRFKGDTALYFKEWKVYHFNDTSESARVKQSGSIHDTVILQPDAQNLAAFLRSIRNTPEYRLIVKNVQRVAPFFLDFVLEPEKDNPNAIRLRWKHRATETYFDVIDFSDGTLRFICLATLLLQPNPPTIILLDEPELGLHPYAIYILAGMLKAVSYKTQIIVSTQSVTLANQFNWDDIIIVDLVTHVTHSAFVTL
jgi:predicted ATPase